MLDIHKLDYYLSGRTLLENVSLHLSHGQKAAIVGRNGAGKSTLFRLILGKVQADKGEISVQKSARVATVAQETPTGTLTPLQHVLDSDQEYKTLMATAQNETDPLKISEIHERLLETGAYDAEARAAKILKGLGFDEAMQHKPMKDFSGGWRMRVALAAVLFLKPDLLLLDEPTNHLDLESTMWLTQYLKSYPGTVILISHDKHVINDVVDRIYHLSSRTLTLYVGNYDQFQNKRFEVQQSKMAQAAKQAQQREHIQKFVDRFRAKTSKAKMVQSRIKRLEKMEEVQLVHDDPTIPIQFPDPIPLAPPLITLEKAALGYGEKIVLRQVNQQISPGACIALLGRNGNGKTTFAKAVAGRLPLLRGTRTQHQNFEVSFFDQHQVDLLEGQDSAFTHMQRLMPREAPTKVRRLLGQFGFTQDMADLAISNLSGGEKTRLCFAEMSIQSPGLLILDEPTNHLDIETREALVLALNAYQGAVMLITHDWDLLSLTATNLWLVENETITPYAGSLDDYQNDILGQKKKAKEKDSKRAQAIKEKKQKKKKGAGKK